jgi:hypothetical protein
MMNLYILDREVTNDIFELSQKILRDFFFYEDETLEEFCAITATTINAEHVALKHFSTPTFRKTILFDPKIRTRFTVFFVGFHICQILINDFHFGEEELTQFENIILKLTEGR